MRKLIFVVDDSDTNLSTAEEALENNYDVMTMPSGAKLFAMLEKFLPDIILLDIEMPGMGGFEALTLLKADKRFKDIPVIFLTAIQDAAVEIKGFEMGVVDFINKPFSAPVLVNRVKHHVNISNTIQERTIQLERVHRNLVFILSDLVESRDETTGGHIDRTAAYIRLLIDAMLKEGVYSKEIDGWDTEMISASAVLHDIGKIGVTDTVLNKPDKLTKDEYNIMKSHALAGARIIDKVIERAGDDVFLQTAKLFAEYHHENWDGTGYPHGLKGDNIPLHGRIMAIADVYDALISARPYKRAFTDDEAVEIILSETGKRFDPQLVSVFYKVRDDFSRIRKEVAKGNLG